MIAEAATLLPLRQHITLYLIRHGETDWNRDFRYQGQRDVPLNAKGREQALRNGVALCSIADRLKAADFVSSPLARAVETMQIIRADLGLAVNAFRTEPQLRELNYGHWEGQLASDLPTADPGGLADKARDPFGWRPQGGESYEDLSKRVADWISQLRADTVAVSHGGVSRVARGAVLGLQRNDIPFLDAPQDRVLVLTSDAMSWL